MNTTTLSIHKVLRLDIAPEQRAYSEQSAKEVARWQTFTFWHEDGSVTEIRAFVPKEVDGPLVEVMGEKSESGYQSPLTGG